jgi:hypothetical protein
MDNSHQAFKGTLDPATETCANTTDEVVFEQTVANNALVNPGTTPPSRIASTTNDGTPTTGTKDGYTIKDGADERPFYWKVFYDGAANGDPDVTSCNENSTVSINNGSGVSNPPTL